MSTALSPQLCGLWDECHLWVQWEALPGATYLLEWRWREAGKKVESGELSVESKTALPTDGALRAEASGAQLSTLNSPQGWSPWQAVRRPGGLRAAWLALPVWKARQEVQARVAVAVAAPAEEGSLREDVPGRLPGTTGWQPVLPAWELAQEVTFSKCRCWFAVTAERGCHLPPGTEINAIVDGAACSYVLPAGVELEAGGRAEIEGEALSLSGYQQLDHAGHFRIRPRLGVVIENSGPSVADTVPTGRDFTVLAALPFTGARMAFQRRDQF